MKKYFTNLKAKLKEKSKDKTGATMLEYVAIALVAIVILGALIYPWLTETFEETIDAMDGKIDTIINYDGN